MTRKTKALSGASQDAYFRRVLKTYPNISDEARERIVRQLRREISQLRVRPTAREAAEAALVEGTTPPSPSIAEAAVVEAPAAAPPVSTPAPQEKAPAAPAAPFDPFAVNVVVLLRTQGKAAAIAALEAISDADNLKLLASEQQLGVSTELSSPEDLSAAIVAAAERRIANRRAAAGSSR